jgi:hypothetical protein
MAQGYLNGGWRNKYFIAKQVHGEHTDVMTGIQFVDPAAQYSVLRFDEDPHARVAMRAYAQSIKYENPQFSMDILLHLGATENTPGQLREIELKPNP